MPTLPAPRLLTLPERTLPDGRRVAPIELSVHEAGQGPAVVMSHGFPELAYSWRHQLPALAEAGFRAIAPDQRGYGASQKPEPIEAYDIQHLTSDMVGLLDVLEIEKAVFVGHDWGGFVVWAMPYLHPERTAGVIGVNTPCARSPIKPTDAMRMLVGGEEERFYVLWFQQPGVADAALHANTRMLFEKIMRGGVDPAEAMKNAVSDGKLDMNPFRRLPELDPKGEPVCTPEELDVFVQTFEETGFTGGINWYRNMDANWESEPRVGAEKIDVPCLMVTAEWDMALRPEMAAGMPALIPNLEMVNIPRCGHWTQQEEPLALNRAMIDWLTRHADELRGEHR
ncbi:MAG: alpha/beta hydrolase [Myxococcota bacterium]|nr:alpha/beta hydrolase [Myxococcota bacterium]